MSSLKKMMIIQMQRVSRKIARSQQRHARRKKIQGHGPTRGPAGKAMLAV
jgi:hypothetical protein